MKKSIKVLLLAMLMPFFSNHLFAQDGGLKREFGLSVGGFTNFPVNQNYLKDNIKVVSLAPYVKVGKHEFYAGFLYPIKSPGLYSGANIHPQLSALAGYKFYLFNIAGRENLYLNYSFQYLRFRGIYETKDPVTNHTIIYNDTPTYINNVISLGYVVYFDRNQRFGFYYTLGYVISQISYLPYNWDDLRMDRIGHTEYIWNHLSTNIGLSFKLKSFDKKMPKGN